MKIAKRALALIFVIILSINGFAAVVTDNDGSAFITKAEFDSLHNTFQEQINTYNVALDNKIDEAIAAYLNGLIVMVKPEIILDSLNSALGGQVWFKNNFKAFGDPTITTNFNLNFTRHYTYQYNDNIKWTAKISYNGDKTQHKSSNWSIFGAGLYLGEVNNDGLATRRIAYAENSYYDTESYYKNYYTYDYQGNSWHGWNAGWDYKHADKTNVSVVKSETTAGQGNCWIYEKKPSGRYTLKQFASSVYPRQNLEVVAHTYKDLYAEDWTNFKKYYCDDYGRKDETVLDLIEVPGINGWGSQANGTKITDTSTELMAQYYKLNQMLIKSTDGEDYSIYMWGSGADNNLHCIEMNQQPVLGNKNSEWNADKTKSTFAVETYKSYTVELKDNNLSGQAFTYYPITMSTDNFNAVNKFSNDYVSQIVGEDVGIAEGVPIIRANQSDQKIRIRLTFKSKGATSSPIVKFKVSDKKFNNNNVATGASLVHEGNVAVGTPYEFELITNNVGDTYWFTCYADTTDETDVAIDTFECITF